MAVGNEIEIKYFTVGDRLPPIADTLTNDEDDVFDLTGYTVAFLMVAEDGTVKVNSAAAVVDSEDDGEVSYLWAAADVDTVGTFYYWWVATHSVSGLKRTFPADGRKRIAKFSAAA